MNTLYLGDAFNLLDKIEPESIDALVTDPPYGIGFGKYNNKDIADTPEGYWKWFKPIYDKALTKIKKGGFIGIWHSQKYLKYLWDWYGDDIHIYSDARNFVQLRKIPINYSWDPVVMFYKDGAEPLRPLTPRRNLDHYVASPSKYFRIENKHPCPRPLSSVVQIVDNFVAEGGTILDLFAGSGTTGFAATLTERNAILFEVDAEYFACMNTRLNDQDLLEKYRKKEFDLLAPTV